MMLTERTGAHNENRTSTNTHTQNVNRENRHIDIRYHTQTHATGITQSHTEESGEVRFKGLTKEKVMKMDIDLPSN